MAASEQRGWHLIFVQRDAEGRLQRGRITVVPEPEDGNVSQRPKPDTGLPPQGRPIYRGAWWTDLGALYANGSFRPDVVVEMGYGTQAPVMLVLT